MTSKEFNSLEVGECIQLDYTKYIIVSKIPNKRCVYKLQSISDKRIGIATEPSIWHKAELTPFEKIKFL